MKALKRLSLKKELMYIYIKDIQVDMLKHDNMPIEYGEIIVTIKRGKEKWELVSTTNTDNKWTFKDKFSMMSKFYIDSSGKAQHKEFVVSVSA